MLERVKQSYFSEEYELGLSLLSKKDELSHTEKIWKIRLLSAMRLFDDVVLLLSETDIPNSPINVIGAFSTALVDSDFQQDFISCIRSYSIRASSADEALRCYELMLRSKLNPQQIVEMIEQFLVDYLDSSSAKMTISAAIRNRTDLLMNRRFRNRFVESLELTKLVSNIALEETDPIYANPPETSTVAQLPIPLLIQLDGLLTPESRKVLIDPIIQSRESQNDAIRSIISTRLIRLSEQGDYKELLIQLRNLPYLEKPINNTEIQKIILNLSSSGIDPIDAILEFERKMANIAGGSINVAKASFRTGHSEIGLRNWNLAYLRYISDPQFESPFPLDTIEIGRIDLIKKLYDRLFTTNASLFLNIDDPYLRKFCSDSELLFALTQNFVERPPFSDRDGGLSEVAILSTILSENKNQTSYDFVEHKVLHVSNSIKIGGAERQVLFSTRAPIVESQLALYNISRNTKENSFINEVEKSGIIVHDYSIEPSSNFHTNCSSSLSLIPDGPGLNPWMTVQIKSLIDIFSKERPEIVHLWQDGTNIIGGIAAILSGVPRIFLSARSTPLSH